MNCKNIIFKSFLSAIEGITLLRPQEITTLESQINLFSRIFSETGVSFGGIIFQIFLSLIVSCFKT